MAWPKGKPRGKKTGGRKAGTPNKQNLKRICDALDKMAIELSRKIKIMKKEERLDRARHLRKMKKIARYETKEGKELYRFMLKCTADFRNFMSTPAGEKAIREWPGIDGRNAPRSK